MPSLGITPAQLTWNGGDLELYPVRMGILPAVLSWAGQSITIGANLGTDLEDELVRLDRLMRREQIVGSEGVSQQFQALWQRTVEKIERAFERVNDVNNAQQVSIDAINAAMTVASSAKQQAEATDAELALVNSKTDPIDGLMSATSDGVITISAHSRDYANGDSVSINSGSVTGAAQGSFVRVYYMDAARTGGAVAYLATTDEITQTGSTHIVGGITIPVAGEPPSTGTGTTPPGYVREPISTL